jgi:hypothetical protein
MLMKVGKIVLASIAYLAIMLGLQTFATSHISPSYAKSAFAISQAQLDEANKVCAKIGYSSDPLQTNCRRGYLGQKGGQSQSAACPNIAGDECKDGWQAAKDNLSTDDGSTLNLGKAHDACYTEKTYNQKKACAQGYIGYLNDESDSVACKGAPDSGACTRGYNAAKAQNPPPTAAMKDACKDFKSNNTYYGHCLAGYSAAEAGKSKAQACEDDYVDKSQSQKACLAGFNAVNASTGGEDDTCTAPGGFGFIICGSIEFFNGTITWIEKNIIEPFLDVTPLSFSDNAKTNPLFAGWQNIRNLANAFFVIIFLVIVFGNTFSIQAYNIKKMLPRLVAAAILVQLSYVLMAAGIDLANILGNGMRALINSITPTLSFDGGALSATAIVGASVLIGFAVASKVASVGFFFALLPLFLGMLAVLFTLVVRQALIVVLVLISPLAIAGMVLPSTQKFFDTWRNLFIRVILMYPLIVLLFAGGKFAAFAASQADGVGGVIAPLIAILCLSAPLLMVPFAFVFAGGIMGRLGKVVANRTNGIHKGVAGSDFNKNRLAERQRNAIMQAESNSPKMLGRFNSGFLAPAVRRYGRAKSGSILNAVVDTSTAQRRRAASYDKLLDQDHDVFKRQAQDNNIGASVMKEMAQGDWTNAKGFDKSDSTRISALRRLMEMRQWNDVAAVKEKLSGPDGERIYKTALQPNFKDVLQGAPDLLSTSVGSGSTGFRPPDASNPTGSTNFDAAFGNGAFDPATGDPLRKDTSKPPTPDNLHNAYGNITADSLKNMHHSTIHRFLETAQHTPNAQQRTKGLMRALQQAEMDPEKRGEIRPEILQAIYNESRRTGSVFDQGDVGWIQRNIDVSGTFN